MLFVDVKVLRDFNVVLPKIKFSFCGGGGGCKIYWLVKEVTFLLLLLSLLCKMAFEGD